MANLAVAQNGQPPAGKQSEDLKANKSFRFLCIGSLISMLGDQLTLITLPWLALFLSPEPWVIGSVMAFMALPMSIFMLFGGAIVDRYSAKQVLFVSKCINTLLMLALALLLYKNLLTLPWLYLFVLLIGTSSAFAIPAGAALLPQIVKPQALPMANGIGMTLRSLTTLIGPLLAALLLGWEFSVSNDSAQNTSSFNLVLVFALDAVSFAISAFLLKYIHLSDPKTSRSDSVVRNIVSGLQHFWSLKELRLLVIYIALITSFLGGMMQVGLPLLVKSQWNEGADVFGLLMAALALGNIMGMFIAAKTSMSRRLSLGLSILLADLTVGVVLMLLSETSVIWHGICALGLMGVLAGYVQIMFISWVQQQAKREMLGRLMSIVMFGLVGLLPLGTALTGVVLQKFSVGDFFLISGGLLCMVAIMTMCFSEIPSIKNANLPIQAN